MQCMNKRKGSVMNKNSHRVACSRFLWFATLFGILTNINVPLPIFSMKVVYAKDQISQILLATTTNAENKDRVIGDDRITFAVENVLHLDSGVSSRLIDIDTKLGIVTLSGSVENLLSKERALMLVETIKGVRAVIDQLVVMPSGVYTDQQIQHDVVENLSRNQAIDMTSLKVSVEDGAATVDGHVDSWPVRDLVLDVAKAVRGVKKVVNHIKVKEGKNRSDSEIKAEIKQRFEADIWLNEWLIIVNVKDGKVTLEGTVSSAAEKTRALKKAWTSGVQNIDGSGLEVQWWARQAHRRAKPVLIKDDEAIEQTILDAWLLDPRIEIFDPSVNVKNGTASLRGSVSTLQAKMSAEQDAKNTIGVFRVKNFLKVRPTEPRTDQEIADDIRAAITRDPFLERMGLSVSVFSGVAYLTGAVDNTFQKTHAENLVSQMPGVVEVLNRLRVPSIHQDKDDREILEDIQDELWWSPFIDSEKIHVNVEDGLVTLTGTVNSWREKQIAGENAREGGAIAVKNKLAVK